MPALSAYHLFIGLLSKHYCNYFTIYSIHTRIRHSSIGNNFREEDAKAPYVGLHSEAAVDDGLRSGPFDRKL